MWPVIMAAARAYAPAILFPVALTIGFIGYNLENLVSDKHTPSRESVIERREKRILQELEQDIQEPLVPKTIFEKNVSPGLQKSKLL